MRSPYLYGGRALRPGEEQLQQNQLNQPTARVSPNHSALRMAQSKSNIPQRLPKFNPLGQGPAMESQTLIEDPLRENDSDLVRLLAGQPPRNSLKLSEIAPATPLEQVLVDLEERERSTLLPQGLNVAHPGPPKPVRFSQISPSQEGEKNFALEDDPQDLLVDPKKLAQQVIGEARETFGDTFAKRLSALAAQEIQGDVDESDPELVAAGFQVLPVVFWTTIRTALRRAAPAVFGKVAVAGAKKASKTATRNRYVRRQKRKKDRLQDEDENSNTGQTPKKPERPDLPEEMTRSEFNEIMGWGQGVEGAKKWLADVLANPKVYIAAAKAAGITVAMLKAWSAFYKEMAKRNRGRPDSEKNSDQNFEQFDHRSRGIDEMIKDWLDL